MSLKARPRVDFQELGTTGVRVYAGRERGRQARLKARLDELDKSLEPVQVYIPEDTMSVTSSFFLSMFGKSIVDLGEEGFRTHYQFSGRDISRVIEDGIRESLNDEDPLS